MLSVHYLIIIIIDFIEEETEAEGGWGTCPLASQTWQKCRRWGFMRKQFFQHQWLSCFFVANHIQEEIHSALISASWSQKNVIKTSNSWQKQMLLLWHFWAMAALSLNHLRQYCFGTIAFLLQMILTTFLYKHHVKSYP